MKTADLTGALLDYWVAKANGPEWGAAIIDGVCRLTLGGVFAPSTDWAQGGPIIEREHIQLKGDKNQWRFPSWLWTAWPDVAGTGQKANGRSHESLLVAAMRAFVASKYGDEVPDVAP